EPLEYRRADRLRRVVLKASDDSTGATGELLDVVLEEILEFDATGWKKGNAVDVSWSRRSVTGETIKPRRIWGDESVLPLPVFTDDRSARLGVGRGRRPVTRVVEWLRQTG